MIEDLEDNLGLILTNMRSINVNYETNKYSKEEYIFQSFEELINSIKYSVIDVVSDHPYTNDTFSQYCDASLHILTAGSKFCIELSNIEMRKGILLSDTMREKVVIKGLLFASQFFIGESCWSSDLCLSTSNCLISSLVELSHYPNLPALLIGEELKNVDVKHKGLKQGVLLKLFQQLSEVFNKELWKKNIFYSSTIFWILSVLKAQNFSSYMAYLLPPPLIMLDDWEIRHKVLAANILKLIINNSAASELRWYGRADVIYQTLSRELYSRDAQLLSVIFPVSISTATVLESNPSKNCSLEKSSYDTIMERLMCEMSFEQQLDRRKVYANALRQLVESMGVMSMRWSKELIDVFANYLETYEGPDAQDRIAILETLEIFIKHCWPRIHIHVLLILKMLTKMVYTLHEEHNPVEEEVSDTLLRKAKSIVDLINAASPETLECCLKDFEEVKLKHSKVSKDLQFIMMNAITNFDNLK